MAHTIVDTGGSRSFPGPHALLRSAGPGGDVLVLIGTGAGMALAAVEKHESLKAVLIELGTECLGVHTGERRGGEGSNVLGFARFRLGDGPPSDLVELVRQPGTKPESIAAAKTAFESAGLHVAVCMDTPGRIVDRLVRPYYNGALRKLDEGLATADDLDTTLRLGLGYPEGPIALLERTGLAHHHDVTKALHDALADPGFAPARRAQVAKRRQKA
ncbi:MAG: 3-hydroxyacyl-CoA dehydrogenase [Rhodospirillales bacterium]|nr:3-hydroxyacyl-CoA dehydrogenase [Rhodospirillales bacterium]